MIDLAAAKRLIDEIGAAPRAAGSEAEARARARCAEMLRSTGFEVWDEPFTYAAFPGRWGIPLTGLLLLSGSAVLLTGIALGFRTGGHLIAQLAIVAAPWPAMGGVGRRAMRRGATNLIAIRGDPNPRVWLCAHLDTKSQPVPTLVRTLGFVIAAVAGVSLIISYWADVAVATIPSGVLIGLALAVAASAIPLLASTVDDGSPGAADNATGVAAVLLTAEATDDLPLGVILTSAEELRLEGASAWAAAAWPAAKRHRPYVIINCDTLDDKGLLRCVYHKSFHKGTAREIVRAAMEKGIPATATRYTPGIMVDSLILAAYELTAVTLSRVTLGTLARIHTRRDTAERLGGEGVMQAVTTMSAMTRMHSVVGVEA